MDSPKRIFMSFLVLTCLGLSSARRLLLDSYDPRMPPRMPKESISDLAERSGSRSDVGFTDLGTGGGFGCDCGSGSGGSFGCGGPGGGMGGGCGSGSGGSFRCGGPCSRCGEPIYVPSPVPTPGFEPFPPQGSSCPCPCYTYAADELAKRTSTPRVGTTALVTPYLPGPGGSCPCSCDGFGVYSRSAAPVQPEFAGRMVMTSAGSNSGVNNDPTSSNASKEDQEAHQATLGYGSPAFVTRDSEPAPRVGSAPKRNQEDQKMMDGNTMAVDDPIT